MERLTKKELCSYTNIDFYLIQIDWHSIYNKLAEIEDFMEEQGFESLEELEHLIGYPVLKDGYDEQGDEINKIEFTTYKKSFQEVFDKNKKLKQENKALKERWEKLWDWICDKKPISKGANAIFKKSEILDKMRELEFADLIRRNEK